MRVNSCLRQRNPQQLALALLANQHPGCEIVCFSQDKRYLRLQLQNEYGDTAQSWLDVDGWLEAMNLHLPEIPWQEVPLAYLVRWLSRLQLSFLYENTVWEAVQIVTCQQSMPEHLLSLPAEPTPLLCVDWPDTAAYGQRIQAISSGLIPFPMKFVLGYSQLRLEQLVALAPGDLLLIKREFIHLAIGTQRIFRLSYYMNLEVIVEEPLAAYDDMHREEDEPLRDWGHLPVDIEFVLDGRTVSLAELDVIRPGTVLALNTAAEQNIKIYLNKTLFARGELVALENGSLAVEVNYVNPGLIGEMDAPNAE